MSKAKKAPTEKQLAARKAFGEAAKKRAADRKAAKENKNPQIQNTPPSPPIDVFNDIAEEEITQQNGNQEPSDPGPVKSGDYEDLARQVMELKAMMFDNNVKLSQREPMNQGGAQATNRGLVGTHEKYSTNLDIYPDPRKRLTHEDKLARFAFPMNYELEWETGITSYETIDGIRQKEPKFTLKLNRIILDEDTGEDTNRRYTICQAIFFEDPEAAIQVALEKGLEVDESNEKVFLDEMRYLRMRDWLFEAFYPPKPQQKINKHETVIDNRIVEVFEINSENSEKLPFDSLKKFKI
jgi:hypothetical protein